MWALLMRVSNVQTMYETLTQPPLIVRPNHRQNNRHICGPIMNNKPITIGPARDAGESDASVALSALSPLA